MSAGPAEKNDPNPLRPLADGQEGRGPTTLLPLQNV